MTAQNQSIPDNNISSNPASDERPKAVLESQKILKAIAVGITSSVQGLERQMLISDMMSRTDETVKEKLHTVMNYLLTRMLSLGASDLDIGGYGSQGSIWYRIFGSKKPDRSWERFPPMKPIF